MRVPEPTRRRALWGRGVSFWIGLGSLVAGPRLVGGCLTELPRRIACGDGFVDREAGEACDPADPQQRHLNACAEQGFSAGQAGCDPETCQVIVDNFQCAVCGDGKVEGNEACDGPIRPANTICPDEARTIPTCDLPTCQADFGSCPSCQNGLHEPNEECDPVDPCDGIAASSLDCDDDDGPPITVPTDCSELEVLAATVDKAAYTRGSVNQADCQGVCRFSRQKCSFCGDGILDPAHNDVGFGGQLFMRPAEQCEENIDVPPPLVQESCNAWCRASSPDVPTSCNYRCINGCVSVELDYDGPIESADPVGQLGCCSPKGTPCDLALEFPCCRALANPGQGDGCIDQVLGTGELQRVCG